MQESLWYRTDKSVCDGIYWPWAIGLLSFVTLVLLQQCRCSFSKTYMCLDCSFPVYWSDLPKSLSVTISSHKVWTSVGKIKVQGLCSWCLFQGSEFVESHKARYGVFRMSTFHELATFWLFGSSIWKLLRADLIFSRRPEKPETISY